MRIRVTASISDAVLQAAAKQLPFATSKALNDVAVAFQEAQRTHMRETFIVRRPQFLTQAVKVTHFAKKDRLFAEVAISAPGGRDDIFEKFEQGGTKKPARGGRHLAIPIPGSPVKRSARSIVPDALRPGALRTSAEYRTFIRRIPGGLGLFGVDRAAEEAYLAQLRSATFGKDGRVQRVRQPKAAQPRLLYFLPSSAPIPRELHFVDTANRVVDGVWAFAFERRWLEATRSAR